MYVNEKIRNVSFVLADMLGCTYACICLWTGKEFLLCWQTCPVGVPATEAEGDTEPGDLPVPV